MAAARAGIEPCDEFMAQPQAQAPDGVGDVALSARGAREGRDSWEGQAGLIQ